MNKQFVAAEICHHKTSGILRQKLTLNEIQLRAQLAGLACDLEEVFILTTRNRFAVYALAKSTARLEKFFNQFDKGCTHVDFYNRDFSTTKHLLETASGRYADPNMISKIKVAQKRAQEAGTIGKILNTIINEALNLGRRQARKVSQASFPNTILN